MQGCCIEKAKEKVQNISCGSVFTNDDGNNVHVTASHEDCVVDKHTNLPDMEVEVFYSKVKLSSYCRIPNVFINMIASYYMFDQKGFAHP